MNDTAIPCVNDLLLQKKVSHKDEKPRTAGLKSLFFLMLFCKSLPMYS